MQTNNGHDLKCRFMQYLVVDLVVYRRVGIINLNGITRLILKYT